MLSIMDAFSVLIRMAAEDKEKNTFITPWGTFCYKVLTFGLKTYQRAMLNLFHHMIHKEMEMYVDDIFVKTKKARGGSCKSLGEAI